jgi:bifunctional enzyme CysN/CysC
MATALLDPSQEAARKIAADVDAYLLANQQKSLLRFITCGSVDDGKSTLIGRLLYDSKLLFEDQLSALEADSRRFGTQGEEIDFALLVDGLAAEREQGITIDVAYRFFTTDKRKFIVADAPGHEQYTRNMVTGASTADLAIILVDARKGVLTQTRRHSYLAHLLGIRRLVLAINKMDLVDYSQARFDAIVADYRAFANSIGVADFQPIPISGLKGDNITSCSASMAWYDGPAMLDHLESVPVGDSSLRSAPFRMAVQWVNRPNSSFRGYAGTIASGEVRPGDSIVVQPSGLASTIERIVTMPSGGKDEDGDLKVAVTGQSVTLTLADEVDCSRGDMIGAASAPVKVADRLKAGIVWMAGEDMVPGRAYWLKIGTQTVSASVARIDEVIDVNSMAREEGRPLELNDIGRCEIVLDRAVPALAYAENRNLGGFILIDRATHATVAAGMIESFPEAEAQAGASEHAGRIIWLTGDSVEQKVAFARKAQQRFEARGRASVILDEESVRVGLNNDLGIRAKDETEHLRRVREVARLISRSGVTVLVAVAANDAAPGSDVHVTDITADAGDWII